MSASARLLGFAFANADFLFEVDGAGTILFAAGAAVEFVAGTAGDVIGWNCEKLFEARDGSRFSVLARTLPPGGRTAMRVKLADGREANLALFRLPENGDRISCTLSRPQSCHNLTVIEAKDGKTGLATRETFLAGAMKAAAATDALTLLDVPALPELCAGMPGERADALLDAIGRSLEKSGAKLAGRLSESRFAAVADARGAKKHSAHLREAMKQHGVPTTEILETLVSMNGRNLRPEQRLLALRYVVERFTAGDKAKVREGDLEQAFVAMMDETHERVRQLNNTVAEGDFELAYQPIKDLKTRALSHYEALSRFKPGKTAETVKFVEALGIADAFDLAVVLKVVAALEQDRSHSATVAFNVSGHTVQSPESFALLTGLLEGKRKLAPRLMIEVTETAQITDLKAAAKSFDALRGLGYRVGLDDFGVGAATLSYLHAFSVDFVKFDGSLVKKLGASRKDDMLLAAMLKLCRELGVTTIAECLESEDEIARARDAGFDHGQGYALGSPGKIPPDAVMRPSGIVAKRKGVQETWG